MVVISDESSISRSKRRVDYNDPRIQQQQKVLKQFRQMERVNCKIQVLCSKLQRLCLNLGKHKRQASTSDSDTDSDTTIENHNNQGYIVGNGERIYLSRLTSHLEQTRCEWEAGLHFVQECIAIRNNDPNTTCLSLYHDTKSLTPPYRAVLSDCITKGNTSLTNISLHMGLWDVPDDVDAFNLSLNMKGIVQYLGSSTILRRVSICGDPTHNAHTRADICLRAISRNPNIIRLELDFPSVGLIDLLSSTTTSIQSLDIHCSNETSINQFDRQKLTTAFANNRTVTSLALREEKKLDSHDDWNLIDGILNGWAPSGYHMPLQKLTLQYDDNSNPDMQSVSFFLAHTKTLQQLTIISCFFNASNMERLLDGLDRHYMALEQHRSLTKLTLTDCLYNREAGIQFLCFMQSTPLYINRAGGSAMLEELHIDFLDIEEDDDMSEITFGDLPLGIAMSSMIMPLIVPTNHGTEIQHTIGSQLKALSLKPFFGMDGFCDHVLSNVSLMQVPKLRLSQIGNEEWLQLATLIPKLKALQELCLFVESHVVTPKDILTVIRETDHRLRSLSVEDDSDSEFFTGPESRLIHALCQRNTELGRMLSRKVHWNFECNWNARNTNKRQKKMHYKMDRNDDVVIFPMLLQAAKQVRSTRVSTILSALLIFEVDCSGI